MNNSKLLMLGLVVAFGSQAAIAQTPAAGPTADSGLALTEVVVTAQRRAERLQDVPVSASVVSGGQLEQLNITSLEDLSARMPDIKLVEGVVDGLFIRGIGSGFNYGFEQAVGTFVDGVYRGRARAIHASLFDIDQIEVLKGPQTTFFGANTVAGALNITTRKPGQEFASNASVLYGWDTGEYSVEGGVTAPLSDKLSVRIAAKAYGEDGYVRNETLGTDEPHERNWVGRVSVAWQPVDNWHMDLRVDHNQDRKHGDGSVLLGCPPDPIYGAPGNLCSQQLAAIGGIPERQLDWKSYNSTRSFENYDMTETAMTNRISLGEYVLTSLTSFFKHQDQLYPSTAPYAFAGVGGVPVAVASAYDESYHQFAQELRFESPVNQTLEYMVGVNFSKGKMDLPEFFGFYFIPFGLFGLPGLVPSSDVASAVTFNQDDKEVSGFGTATWHVSDALRINAGLRYSVVDKTAHSLTTFGTAGLPPSYANYVEGPPLLNAILASPGFFSADLTDFTDTSRRDSKLMPSASVQYNVAKDAMTYISYSNGFKAGGFGTNFARSTFAPEYVDAFETGIKAGLLDRRLLVNLAVFLSKYKDLQENTSIIIAGGIPQNTIRNAARAESKGVELGVDFRATSVLVLNADLAYLNSKYTSYPNAPCTVYQNSISTAGTGCRQDLTGSVRQYSPKYSGNIGATLTLPVAHELEVRVNPSFYFTSGFFEAATVDPLLYQGGYGKFDLRIGLGPTNGRWEVALLGKNLTDKATAMYRNTAIDNGVIDALPEAPRTVAIQVSYKN